MGEGGCVLVTFTSTANGYECNIDGLFFLVSFFFLFFFFFLCFAKNSVVFLGYILEMGVIPSISRH